MVSLGDTLGDLNTAQLGGQEMAVGTQVTQKVLGGEIFLLHLTKWLDPENQKNSINYKSRGPGVLDIFK